MDASKERETLLNEKNQEASTVIKRSKQEVENPLGSIADKRQTRNLQPRWGWVEESIWKESMLTALENGVQGVMWFSLIDKVYRPKTLERAWKKVQRGKGAAGVDDVSIKRVANNPEKYLNELQEQLQTGSYRTKPVKRVFIPKGDGKTRPLGIPTVLDRTVQNVLVLDVRFVITSNSLILSLLI